MACQNFEDRLIDYAELTAEAREAVDAHLAVCEACRDYLETLDALDSELAQRYSAVQAPPAFAKCVRARREDRAEPRLTMTPELLDFAGWAAVIAAAAALVLVLPRPPQALTSYASFAALAFAAALAAWAAARTYAELNH